MDQGSSHQLTITSEKLRRRLRSLQIIFHGVMTKFTNILQIAKNSRTILHRFIPVKSLFFKELPGEGLFEIPDEERLLRTDSL